MHPRRILAALVAAVMALGLASPAEAATDAEARQAWRTYALDELAKVEAQFAQGPCPTNEPTASDTCYSTHSLAWTYAYTAELHAFKEGTWNNPKTLDYLQKVYAERKTGTNANGYGMNKETDAFQDGTTNSAATTYTVTTADHVGDVLINGYLAGVVPAQEVRYAVEAVMAIERVNTYSGGHGKCIIYSSQTTNDGDYCVINVSAGAAAFLKRAWDAGIRVPDQDVVYTQMQEFVAWSYEQAYEEHADGTRTIAEGFWPYAWNIRDTKHGAAGTFTRAGRAQDWNHNGYTAESAQTLGMVEGNDSVQKMLDDPGPNYRSPNRNLLPTYNESGTDPREVQGRLRAQSLMPARSAYNALQDAEFYADKVAGPKYNTSLLQGARWASRLASTATGDSIEPHKTTFMSTPKVFDVNYNLISGNPANVGSRNKIILWTDARQGNSTLGWTYIANRPVELVVDGVVVQTKTTDIDGMVRFVWEVKGNECFYARVAGDHNSNQKCITTS